VLVWLRDRLPPGGDERQLINAVLPPPSPPGVPEVDHRPPAEWLAAREQLLVDADALLPP
jgi:hypothetical protein